MCPHRLPCQSNRIKDLSNHPHRYEASVSSNARGEKTGSYKCMGSAHLLVSFHSFLSSARCSIICCTIMAFLLPKPPSLYVEGQTAVSDATSSTQRPSFEPVKAHRKPRSQHVPDAVWEQHRAEISSLYKQSTLTYVMECMQRKYNFYASYAFGATRHDV